MFKEYSQKAQRTRKERERRWLYEWRKLDAATASGKPESISVYVYVCWKWSSIQSVRLICGKKTKSTQAPKS